MYSLTQENNIKKINKIIPETNTNLELGQVDGLDIYMVERISIDEFFIFYLKELTLFFINFHKFL